MEEKPRLANLEETIVEKLGQYIELLENVTDSVMITDLDGMVLMWNKGAEEIFGYKKEEMIGTNVSRLYRKEDLESIKVIRDRALKGQRIANFEIREIKRKGKSPVAILLSIVPLKDKEGRVFRLAGIGKDITDIRKMESELVEAQRLDVVHEMVVALNHEMNQPIAVTSSLLQMIIKKMREGVKPTVKGMEMIHKQIMKISELLSQIHHIKRIVTTDYIKGIKMIDLKKSLEEEIKKTKEGDEGEDKEKTGKT